MIAGTETFLAGIHSTQIQQKSVLTLETKLWDDNMLFHLVHHYFKNRVSLFKKDRVGILPSCLGKRLEMCGSMEGMLFH